MTAFDDPAAATVPYWRRPVIRSGPQDRSSDTLQTPGMQLSGHPRFVFLAGGEDRHIETSPGDFVYVPAWVPHREEHPSADDEAIVVLARSTPEETVVNLPDLWSVEGIPGAVA
jgi:uncharacterized RmlC-like cupin family protein